MRLLIPFAAAAVLLIGAISLWWRDRATSESSPAAPTIASRTPANAVDQPSPANSLMETRAEREDLRRKSLEQCVAEAQVIVVATALDSAPAPPNVPGDLPENYIRFRVTRHLKGQLTTEIIRTRTPTSPSEFIGRDWVVMLSPEYLASQHSFAGPYGIKLESQVTAALGGDKE